MNRKVVVVTWTRISLIVLLLIFGGENSGASQMSISRRLDPYLYHKYSVLRMKIGSDSVLQCCHLSANKAFPCESEIWDDVMRFLCHLSSFRLSFMTFEASSLLTLTFAWGDIGGPGIIFSKMCFIEAKKAESRCVRKLERPRYP